MTNQTNLFEPVPEIIPKKSFFNTINVSGEKLKKYNHSARSQEARVLKVFQSGERLTALEVTARLNEDRVSIRRAITNLFNEDRLVKLDEKVMERRGRENHYYKLR